MTYTYYFADAGNTAIKRTDEDGNVAFVPVAPGNRDYDAYLASGITADAYVAPIVLESSSSATSSTNQDSVFVAVAGDTMTGDLICDTTGALTVPVGTDSQRPSSPATGMVRHNTTSGILEFYDGTSWTQIGGGSMNTYRYVGIINITHIHGLGMTGMTLNSLWTEDQGRLFPGDPENNKLESGTGTSGTWATGWDFTSNTVEFPGVPLGGGNARSAIGAGPAQIHLTYTT